ncbi:MAG TPA: hypothetical protein VNE71_05875, partial [Myxococcota bacterium]|nr:hypothetical protein [Myxococcota bacterium]
MTETTDQISGAVGAIIDEQGTAPLTKEAAARLDKALAPSAADADAAREVSDRLRATSRIVAHGHNMASMYAAGWLEAAAGNAAGAHDAFTQLTGALERAEAWDGFAVAAARALELTSHPDFARCLARAWEKSGRDGVPAALLVEASRVAPDDHRLRWAAGFALDREGQRVESERHIAASIPGFIQKGEFPRVEEAYLRLLETEDPVVAGAVLDALVLLTRQMGAAAAPYWELASSFLSSQKMHDRAWAFFKEYLAKHTEHEALRAAALRAFRGVALARGIAEEMINAPGIASPTRPLPEAIARTDLLLGWPPGLYVDHRFSGIGRVLANNCDMLRIDFTRGPQELSLEIAGRSLLKLDPADLRVRLAFDRAGLAQQAAEQPASLVHAALVTLRGEGTLPELKRTLIPNAVSLEAWTDFWRRAQKGMKDDPRFDLSQTVRKIYRIADPTKRPALALPQFDVKEKLARRVDTLEKFLDENA